MLFTLTSKIIKYMKEEYKYRTTKEILKDKWFWYILIGYIILVLTADWANAFVINELICK